MVWCFALLRAASLFAAYRGLIGDDILRSIDFAMMFCAGIFAKDWHEKSLTKRHYNLVDIICAQSEEKAKYKFFIKTDTDNL